MEIAKHYNWIKPYSGIKQSWVLKNRELDLSFMANDGAIDKYLEKVPSLELLKNKIKMKPKTLRSILKNKFK